MSRCRRSTQSRLPQDAGGRHQHFHQQLLLRLQKAQARHHPQTSVQADTLALPASLKHSRKPIDCWMKKDDRRAEEAG